MTVMVPLSIENVKKITNTVIIIEEMKNYTTLCNVRKCNGSISLYRKYNVCILLI